MHLTERACIRDSQVSEEAKKAGVLHVIIPMLMPNQRALERMVYIRAKNTFTIIGKDILIETQDWRDSLVLRKGHLKRKYNILNCKKNYKYFGFTIKETEDLCKKQDKITFRKLNKWYNGYKVYSGID